MSDPIASITAVAPVISGEPARGFVHSAVSQNATTPTNTSSDAPTVQQVEQSVATLNTHFAEQKPPFEFRLGRDNGDLVVSVINPHDGSVVRQIPSKEILKLAREAAHSHPQLLKQTA